MERRNRKAETIHGSHPLVVIHDHISTLLTAEYAPLLGIVCSQLTSNHKVVRFEGNQWALTVHRS